MIVAVLCALAGTALLVGGVDRRALHAKPLDWGIAFLSAFVFAFYIVYSKRGLARYAPETVLLYTFAIAAVFWAIVTPPWKHRRRGLLAAACGASSCSSGCSRRSSRSRSSTPGCAGCPQRKRASSPPPSPLVAIVAAAVFLHEQLRPMQFAGAGLVLAGGAAREPQRPRGRPAAVERG